MKKIFGLAVIVIVMLLTGTCLADNEIGYDWVVNMEKDPLTDEVNIMVMGFDVGYFEGKSSWESDLLGIRLGNGEIDLIVSPSDYIGSGNNDVKFRFDDGEVISAWWPLSTDHRGLFHPDYGTDTVKGFVEKMIVHDRLVFNFQPYQKNRQNIIFCTINFGPELEPYLEHFGWEDLADLIN